MGLASEGEAVASEHESLGDRSLQQGQIQDCSKD